MTYTIVDGSTTINMGSIQQDGGNGDSGVTVVPSSLGGSSEAEAVKLINASQIYDIQGVITGALATMQTFIANMNTARGDYANSALAKKVLFNSDLTGSNQRVIILNFTHDWIAGSPSKLMYTVRLQKVKA